MSAAPTTTWPVALDRAATQRFVLERQRRKRTEAGREGKITVGCGHDPAWVTFTKCQTFADRLQHATLTDLIGRHGALAGRRLKILCHQETAFAVEGITEGAATSWFVLDRLAERAVLDDGERGDGVFRDLAGDQDVTGEIERDLGTAGIGAAAQFSGRISDWFQGTRVVDREAVDARIAAPGRRRAPARDSPWVVRPPG